MTPSIDVSRSRNGVIEPRRELGHESFRRARRSAAPAGQRPTDGVRLVDRRGQHDRPGVVLTLRVGQQPRTRRRGPGCAGPRRGGRCARLGAGASTAQHATSVSGVRTSSRRCRIASSGSTAAAGSGSAAGSGRAAPAAPRRVVRPASPPSAGRRRRRGRRRRDGWRRVLLGLRSRANMSPAASSAPAGGGASADSAVSGCSLRWGAERCRRGPRRAHRPRRADPFELGEQGRAAAFEVVEHALAHRAGLVDHRASLRRGDLFGVAEQRGGSLSASGSGELSSGSAVVGMRVVARRGACHPLDAIGQTATSRDVPVATGTPPRR